MESGLILITTTNDDRVELETIAKTLIDKQLAACCQISSPIESIYHWDKKIASSQEWVCSIKTTKRHFNAVNEIIHDLHHYDVPQVVAVDIVEASKDYEAWVREFGA